MVFLDIPVVVLEEARAAQGAPVTTVADVLRKDATSHDDAPHARRRRAWQAGRVAELGM